MSDTKQPAFQLGDLVWHPALWPAGPGHVFSGPHDGPGGPRSQWVVQRDGTHFSLPAAELSRTPPPVTLPDSLAEQLAGGQNEVLPLTTARPAAPPAPATAAQLDRLLALLALPQGERDFVRGALATPAAGRDASFWAQLVDYLLETGRGGLAGVVRGAAGAEAARQDRRAVAAHLLRAGCADGPRRTLTLSFEDLDAILGPLPGATP